MYSNLEEANEAILYWERHVLLSRICVAVLLMRLLVVELILKNT